MGKQGLTWCGFHASSNQKGKAQGTWGEHEIKRNPIRRNSRVKARPASQYGCTTVFRLSALNTDWRCQRIASSSTVKIKLAIGGIGPAPPLP